MTAEEESIFLSHLLDIKKELTEKRIVSEQQGETLSQISSAVQELRDHVNTQNGRIKKLETETVPTIIADVDELKKQTKMARQADKESRENDKAAINYRFDRQDEIMEELKKTTESTNEMIKSQNEIFGGEDQYKIALKRMVSEQHLDILKRSLWKKTGQILIIASACAAAVYYIDKLFT